LRAHPERVAHGPYTIPIPISRAFDARMFGLFHLHFLRYRQRYKNDDNLGRSLARFADIDNTEACLDGLYALFSFHRQNPASWYYLVTCFRHFRRHPPHLRRRLALILSLLPGHMDIWWHMDNVIDDAIEQQALSLVERRFGAEEVAMLLEIIEEGGFERGTIGQAVHAIIDVVPDKNRILEGLAFDPAMSEDARYWALLLLVFHRQFAARSWCVQIIDRYMARFPADENEDVLASLRQSMVEGDTLDLY